jgi:hypothetical protein
MSIRIEQTKYEPIPEGMYRAKIEGIEQETGKFGEQLKFKFVLDPLEGFREGKYLLAWCSAKFSPKTKLYQWTHAILGNIDSGYVFDSDDLLNKPVMLVIGQRPAADGNKYDCIESIKPDRVPAALTPDQINQVLGEAEVPD